MINHHDIPENTHLARISMLKSHNARTYDFSGFKSAGAVFTFAFKTQSLNLIEQAIAGARYFDIHVAEKTDSSFDFFHSISATGGNAVADVRDLLSYAKEGSKNFMYLNFH